MAGIYQRLTYIAKQIVDVSGSNKKYAGAKAASQKIQEDIQNGTTLSAATATQFLEPFKLACEASRELTLHGISALNEIQSCGLLKNPDDVAQPFAATQVALATVVQTMLLCAANTKSSDEEVLIHVVSCLLNSVTGCNVHGDPLKNAAMLVFDLCVTNREHVHTTAKQSLTQMLNHVFDRLERRAGGALSPRFTTPTLTPLTSAGGPSFDCPDGDELNAFQHDAMLIFTFLCEEASKSEAESGSEASGSQRVLLALDMLNQILNESGTAFRNSKLLLMSVREKLLTCLLKNCVSSTQPIFKVALNLFSRLVISFKRHLKREVGVLLSHVFLKLLDSPNTPAPHKITVLLTLKRIASSPQVVLDIFVNYDCCIRSQNLFERIVSTVSKIVQADLYHTTGITPRDEALIKQYALETLVSILKSMREWMSISGSGKEGGDKDGALTSSDDIEKQRKRKVLQEQGVAIFANSCVKGMKFFIEHGMCFNRPDHIARFLKFTHALDRDGVADYVGAGDDTKNAPWQGPTHFADVRSEYIKLTDCWREPTTDEALRKFLATNKLPKEGPRIERILEAWSLEYFNRIVECPEAGASSDNADCLYLLVGSIVMLNTSLHSEKVQERQTKDQFKSMLKKCNNGKDFDEVQLEAVFDRMQANPFRGETFDNAATQMQRVKKTAVSTEERRQQHLVESQQLVRHSRALIDEGADPNEVYYTANDIGHLQPMFAVLWAPMLAAFAAQLELLANDNNQIITACLDGLMYGTEIAAEFEMPTERDSYVGALCKLTNISGLKVFGMKHIESIKKLMAIAMQNGNNLRSSWVELIRTVSQLEELHVFGTSSKAGKNADREESNQSPTIQDEIQMSKSYTISNVIDETIIQRLFANTVHMTQEGMSDFVEALCKVCKEELLERKVARKYCLTKLIEVVTENLGARITLIWSSVSSLFFEIGMKASPEVAQFSIDALRQMVSKCLDHPELVQTQNQNELLDTFARITQKNECKPETHDMVLRCLMHIIGKHAGVIQKGWSPVFRMLVRSAKDTSDEIVQLGYSVFDMIITEHFQFIGEHFVPAVHALCCFADSTSPVVSKRVIDEKLFTLLERICADVASGKGSIAADTIKPIWLELLHNIAMSSWDTREDVRSSRLKVLERLASEYRKQIEDWGEVFEMIFLKMLHEPLDSENSRVSRDEWLSTTGLTSCEFVVDEFCAHWKTANLSPKVFKALMEEIRSLAMQDHQSSIRIALQTLRRLAEKMCDEATEADWGPFLDTFVGMIRAHAVTQADIDTLSSESERAKWTVTLSHIAANMSRQRHINEIISHLNERPTLLWGPAQRCALASAYREVLAGFRFEGKHLQWLANALEKGGRDAAVAENLLMMQKHCWAVYLEVTTPKHGKAQLLKSAIDERRSACDEVWQRFIRLQIANMNDLTVFGDPTGESLAYTKETLSLAPVIALIYDKGLSPQ